MKSPRSETVIVTPSMADNWLNHSLYERQRKRADWHVRRLAIEMEKGRFIAGTQIHFGTLNGKPRLVNGQHTLAAIVRSDIPIELTILHTPVESEIELGQLYARHDRHRSRTPHDAFLGMGLSERLALSEQEVNSLGSAMKWILSGFRRVSVQANPEAAMSLDLLSDEMVKYAPSAALYFECVREARHGMKGAFRRSPVVAVGIATFMHRKEKATEFWSGAAQDNELHRLDPRRALNSFLLSNSSGYGDPLIYMRNVAGAWNKFYENGELQFLRPGDSGKIGITIKGTPYKAEKRKGTQPASAPIDDTDPPASATAQLGLGEARV